MAAPLASACGGGGGPGRAIETDAEEPPAIVDAATARTPPYGRSHQLISSAQTGSPHGSTTPKAAAGYRHLPVGRHMMGL